MSVPKAAKPVTAHPPFSYRNQSIILSTWEDTEWTVIYVPSIGSQEIKMNPTHVSWTDPTTNVDGTAIAAGEITGYQVGVRLTTATGSVAGTYPILSPVVSGSGSTT